MYNIYGIWIPPHTVGVYACARIPIANTVCAYTLLVSVGPLSSFEKEEQDKPSLLYQFHFTEGGSNI